MGLKLGCHISPPRDRARMLKLKEFRAPLAAVPSKRDWYEKTSGIKMHRNDELGICTCAGGANIDQLWTANAGHEVVIGDDVVTKDYELVGGYDPSKTDKNGNNPTDNGACLSDVLKAWQNQGLFGSKIGPYLAVDATDWEEVCFAMNAGVGLYCGLSLPQAAMDAMELPKPIWAMPKSRSGKRIIGGHCVIEGSYDMANDTCGTGTWAQVVPTEADFVANFFSEMYLIFSIDFLKDGVAPNGFNGPAILDAMAQVKKH